MSEFQPQEPTEIQFSLGEHEFSFTEDNLPRIFINDEDPKFDHLIYIAGWEDGQPTGLLIFWREVFEAHDIDATDLMDFLVDEGVDCVRKNKPLPVDLHLYDIWQKGKEKEGRVLPLLYKLGREDEGGETAGIEPSQELVHVPRKVFEIPHPEEEWGQTKKDQAEKWGGFVAYLAESIANGEREA